MAILIFKSVLALVAVLILKAVWKQYQFSKKYKFPNVVPGWPILGSTLDVPLRGGMWGVEMAQKYGEMYTCFLGGRAMAYLNSSRVVNDLMEKRSSIYSSRQYRPMCQDIMSGGGRMLFMPYNDRWRNQRKIMHSILNAKQAETKFRPFQELEVKQLLWDCLQSPDRFYRHAQRYSNSVIMSVVFGRRAADDDPGLLRMLHSVEVLTEYLFGPGKNLVDPLPWLAKLPKALQWWRKPGEAYFTMLRRRVLNFFDCIYKEEYDRVIEKMNMGTALPCFATEMIQGAEKKEFVLDDDERLLTFTTLIEAGSDTSRVSIIQLVAAAAVFPGWVKTAKKSLDEVCGNAERLPTLDDRERLPYITAAVKETFRWRPFIENGMPHELIQDDEYEGYRFPAGTQFTWNAYAIALNENEYSDPLVFRPERFMNADLNSPMKGHWGFGTGRRVCVGYNVGQANVWLALACLIYCFDFEQDLENPIDTLNSPWVEWKKAPFKVIIKPRSRAYVELINRVAPEALNAKY